MKTKKKHLAKLRRFGSNRKAVVLAVCILVATVGTVYVVASRADTISSTGISATTNQSSSTKYYGQLCEVFASYCANTSNFNDGTVVYQNFSQNASRAIAFYPDGGRFNFGGQSYVRGTLVFYDRIDRCALYDSSRIEDRVDVYSCAGYDGTNWALGYSNNHMVLINDYWSRIKNQFEVLAGDGVQGDKLTVRPYGDTSWFEKFYFK